jgi:hypothetical protein
METVESSVYRKRRCSVHFVFWVENRGWQWNWVPCHQDSVAMHSPPIAESTHPEMRHVSRAIWQTGAGDGWSGLEQGNGHLDYSESGRFKRPGNEIWVWDLPWRESVWRTDQVYNTLALRRDVGRAEDRVAGCSRLEG